MSAIGTKQTFRDRAPMSAFGGTADIDGRQSDVGHRQLKIAAAQTDHSTPFCGSQIPTVISRYRRLLKPRGL